MTETAAQALLARLAKQYGSEPYDATRDITAHNLALEMQISECSARRFLRCEVSAGRLQVRPAMVNGYRTKVYRRV